MLHQSVLVIECCALPHTCAELGEACPPALGATTPRTEAGLKQPLLWSPGCCQVVLADEPLQHRTEVSDGASGLAERDEGLLV